MKLSELSASRWLMLSVGAVLAWIWLLPLFPTQDGPMHVYHARMMLDAGRLSPLLEWNTWHLPQWTSQVLTIIALRLFDADLAYRLMQSIAVLLFPFMLWRVHLPGDPRGVAATLALLWMLGLGFSMGFWAFLIGLSALPLADRWCEQGKPRWVAMLLLLAYYTHPLPWLAAWLMIAMRMAMERQWKSMWVLLPSGLIASLHVTLQAPSDYYLPTEAPSWMAVASGGLLMMTGRYPFEMARGVVLLVAVAIVLAPRWREHVGALAGCGWLAVGGALGVWLIPDAIFGGTMVKVRVAMVVSAAGLCWLAKTTPYATVMRWLSPGLAFIVLATCLDRYRLTKQVEPLWNDIHVGVAKAGTPDALIALSGTDELATREELFYAPLLHGADLMAARLGVAMIYQQPAACGTFPLRWVKRESPDAITFEGHPPQTATRLRFTGDLRIHGLRVGHVLVWGEGASTEPPPRSRVAWTAADGFATLYSLE